MSPSKPAKSDSRPTVLVVDDEPANRELVEEILSKKYNVLTAADGEEGKKLALEHVPDVILLDVTMPKIDGITLCNELRNHEVTKHSRIIMLTGVADPEVRVDSFIKGADDYLNKPFKASELMARVMSKLRRVEEVKGVTKVLECGNLTMDEDKMAVLVEGKEIMLSALEFSLLKYFVQNKEKVLSRERILEAVWHDSSVTDRTIDTHMVSIRKKLAGFDHEIRSVYGAGYVLKKP